MAKSVGQVNLDLNLNKGNKFDNQVKQATAGTENAFATSMKKVGGFIAGAFAVKKIADFTKSAISSATQVQAAWTGLKSIADGTGKSFASAQNFIAQYTKDGLVSINEATSAYKNLLSRGYDTTQIENTMNALKDSAAFGRQASYDLGEAVVSATEGLKNENSILVDNAGVTKNVAKMWEDWAKAHNTTTSAMTQAQKIEAEYNGILNETKFQTGDAATYTKTFGGQVQMLKMSFSNLQIAVGKAVAPIVQLFIPVINSALVAITNFFVGVQSFLKTFGISFPDVVSKSSKAMSSIGGSAVNTASDISSTGDAATKAAKKINRAFGSVDEINVLNTKQSDSDSSSGAPTDVGGVSFDDSGISSISDKTEELSSKFIKLKGLLSSIWDSSPVQSFAGAVRSYGQFVFDYWKTLGTNLITNIQFTWDNVKNNLQISLDNMTGLWTQFWTDVQVGIDTWGQPIIDGVSGIFNSIWLEAIDPAIQLITQAWKDFSGILVSLWNKHGKPLIDNIGEFATKVIEYFQKIWDDVLEPIITPFLETMSWLWDKHIKDMVESVGDFIGKLINGALEIYNKFIQPILLFLLDYMAPAWSFLSNLVIGVVGTIVGYLSDMVKSATRILGGIIDFITGIFTLNWSKAWKGVQDIFSGLIGGIAGIFKAPLNFIIDVINSFIAGLNKIHIPDWVPAVGGKGFNIPKIPKLAQGGYAKANDPQLAIIGDNTREGEIVSPESKIYEQALKAIKDSGGTGGTQQLEITIYHKYEDGRTIIQKVNQAQIDAGEILLLT